MKITDLGEIALAWYHSANPTPEQRELANERLAVCGACEFSKHSEMFDIYKCTACGCPLHKKVFSPRGIHACPKGKWVR